MSFVYSIIHKRLDEAKEILFARLNEIVSKRLEEAKRYVAEDMLEFVELEEAGNNIVRMGRVQKIRRRIRRNAKGRIVVQKNVRRSSIKGY